MFSSLARGLLARKRPSATDSIAIGTAIGAPVGVYGAYRGVKAGIGLLGRHLEAKGTHIPLTIGEIGALGLLAAPGIAAGGAAVGAGAGAAAGGAVAALRQVLHRRRVSALAKKLRIAAGVTAGGAAGLGALGALSAFRKKD